MLVTTATSGCTPAATVALVGFGDEAVAAAVVRVGSRLAQVAADGERRVHPGVLQRDDEHRGGRGLAVCAGDQQGVLTAISLASTTGRRITGIPRSAAATSSGLVFGIAAWW